MRFVNENEVDRALRVVLGLVLLAVGWSGIAPDLWGVAMRLFGWFPLVTGLIGWCPFYALFDFSTRKNGSLRSNSAD